MVLLAGRQSVSGSGERCRLLQVSWCLLHASPQVLLEEQVPVVSFYFGLPEEALLAEVKASGAVTIGTATCLDEAQQLEAAGAVLVNQLVIVCVYYRPLDCVDPLRGLHGGKTCGAHAICSASCEWGNGPSQATLLA